MTTCRTVITQGEHTVSADGQVTISTLLGSCVACCLWDPLAGVGGMNHMLLTNSSQANGHCDLAGVNAMELLINDLLKLGARRDRLLAKAFGGAQMVSGLSQIGAANCAFTLDFLAREGIECVAQSLGGTDARQLLFWPTTGAAKLKISRIDAAPEPRIPAPVVAEGNGLELF